MIKVKVSSRPERFRRAGMEFTREAREVDVDEKTLAILQGEPLLAVEVLEEIDESNGKGKGKGKGKEGA